VKLAPEAIEALAAAIVEAQKPDGALLDAEAAAKLLNVKASWVLGEARHDRIPWVPVGRYVRFNRDDLLAWSDARARGPRVPRTGNGPVPKGGEGQ
jgi:excisionase family DNA binding protein